MSQTTVIIFILGIFVGIGVGFVVWKKTRKTGLIETQAREKEENKRKISEFMNGQDRVSNDDIQNLLGVSDATATRYLDELEKEGIIRQVGKTGRHVYYEKV